MIEVVQIHTRGFGPKRSAQPWPAWGAQSVATRLTGDHPPRSPEQISGTAKSSTMKGPQGLAGNCIFETELNWYAWSLTG